VHLVLANMFVGAKHDRIQYGIITNNLSAVMLRPSQKPDAPGRSPLASRTGKKKEEGRKEEGREPRIVAIKNFLTVTDGCYMFLLSLVSIQSH
jgi:hypothetical protein